MAVRYKMNCGVVLVLLSLFVGGCAEISGSGKSMLIPNVRVSCSANACLLNGQRNAYAIYTTSGCLSPDFGQVAAGSVALTCNGIGCSGTVSQFVDSNSRALSTIAEGTYSVFVSIDITQDWSGSANSGDVQGQLTNAALTSGTLNADVSVFTAVP